MIFIKNINLYLEIYFSMIHNIYNNLAVVRTDDSIDI